MQKHIIRFSVIFLLIFIGSSTYFIHKGFTHVLPQSILRWSKQNWNDGEHMESIKWFVNSHKSAFDAGFRYTIAEYYFNRIKTFHNQGNLPEALETCYESVKVLGGHDDEGAHAYYCWSLEQEIQRQK